MATQKQTDAIVRRHIHSLRFGSGVANKTLRQILDYTAVSNIIKASYNVPARRRQALVKELKRQYKGVKKEILESLAEYVTLDVDWFNQIFSSDVKKLAKAESIIAHAISIPFPEIHSTPLDLLDRAFNSAGSQLGFVSDQISLGLVPLAEALDSAKGIYTALSRHVDTSVATMTMATASETRHMMYSALGTIRGYIITAVLDGRTSSYCRRADGDYHDKASTVKPPFHPRCRTTTIPVLEGETEDQAREMLEYRAQINPGENYRKGDNTLKNDKKHREKGRISVESKKQESSSTYADFLASQTKSTEGKAFIRDVLGVTKGNTFIKDITSGVRPESALGKNYDRFGKELTLKELKRRKLL